MVLNEIEGQASRLGFRTVAVEATEDKPLPLVLLPHLRKLFLELGNGGDSTGSGKSALRIFRSFLDGLKKKYGKIDFTLAGEAAAGAADSGDLAADLTAVFIGLGAAAADRKTAVSILIDEMQFLRDQELAALITAFHKITEMALPVMIAGAGLPQLVLNAINARSYAERLFAFPEIGALGTTDAMRALREPAAAAGAEFDEAAARKIVRITQGFPYFLQTWGYYAWNSATKSPIGTDVIRKVAAATIEDLDKNFFRYRFERLTRNEKLYLEAMSELGPRPQPSGAIAKKFGSTTHAVGTLRDALIKKGTLYSPKYGQTAFTVPLFDEFVRRTMPNGDG